MMNNEKYDDDDDDNDDDDDDGWHISQTAGKPSARQEHQCWNIQDKIRLMMKIMMVLTVMENITFQLCSGYAWFMLCLSFFGSG